jgi:hypothetical protein
MQAYARIYQSLQAHAASLAYIDTFMVLCVGAAIMFCLAFVLKKNDPGGSGVRVAECIAPARGTNRDGLKRDHVG